MLAVRMKVLVVSSLEPTIARQFSSLLFDFNGEANNVRRKCNNAITCGFCNSTSEILGAQRELGKQAIDAPKQFRKRRKEQDKTRRMNVEARLQHQAFSFLMAQQHDAFIKYAVRNGASRQEIRRIMLEHDCDTARPGHPPELRYEARTLRRVDVMHDADGNNGIERMVSERKPIAIVGNIGDAWVTLGGSSDAFS